MPEVPLGDAPDLARYQGHPSSRDITDMRALDVGEVLFASLGWNFIKGSDSLQYSCLARKLQKLLVVAMLGSYLNQVL